MENESGRKLKAGDAFPALRLTSIRHQAVPIPDPGSKYVHLQFRRYAGCPICNLHMHQFAKRAEDLKSRGIREVAVFHSSEGEMLPYEGELPFDVIADPEKALYKRFGVETSLGALLNVGAMLAALKGALETKPTMTAENGRLGLPADFLIGPDGRVKAAKYGGDANDQWSVDELLALAQG